MLRWLQGAQEADGHKDIRGRPVGQPGICRQAQTGLDRTLWCHAQLSQVDEVEKVTPKGLVCNLRGLAESYNWLPGQALKAHTHRRRCSTGACAPLSASFHAWDSPSSSLVHSTHGRTWPPGSGSPLSQETHPPRERCSLLSHLRWDQ